MTMTAKLKVDLASGLLEVEGDEQFVRDIHEQFRQYAKQPSARPAMRQEQDSDGGDEEAASEQPRRRSPARRRRQNSGEDTKTGIRPSHYAPTVVKDLNLTGLKDFYGQFELKTHFDKLLVFATFLRDEKDIHPCTADQLFTCYRVVGERPPGAFLQAIRDASTKKSLLDYQTPEHVTLTHIGDDRFLHDVPRKAGS